MLVPPPSVIPSLHFSGHETFPLRQLWLRKAYDSIKTCGDAAPKSLFADEAAIVRFGVGKNMVNAIKHWTLATGFMDESKKGTFSATSLARAIFADHGLDPFSEHPTTAWLIHWKLAGIGSRSTTWWWIFNTIVQPRFQKESVVHALQDHCLRCHHKVSDSTLVRDVDVCIASYASRMAGESREDAAEPILVELGLLQQEIGTRGFFSFRRGPKKTLTVGLFAFALIEFWQKCSDAAVLSFEKITYDYSSPGRVFKLDENSVAEYVLALEKATKGVLRWSDSGGIRQVYRTSSAFSEHVKETLLRAAYE